MNQIELKGRFIPYNIVKKRNKNTYYHFKQAGYVQINLSRHQTIKSAISYMRQHADTFLVKYDTHCVSSRDRSRYYLWGEPYQCIIGEQDVWEIDPDNKILYQPTQETDRLGLKQLEQRLLQARVDELKLAYRNHPLVDISGVRFTIKSMTSRHGSCNKTKRRISLNLNLVHHHPKYLTYVFLHEIAHLVFANHSKEYYDLLEQLCPNYKSLRAELRADW